MLELILAFFVLLLIMSGMAIGVIMGRKPLKGSCGGVGAALGEKDYSCDLCGGDPNKCDELSQGGSSDMGQQQSLSDVDNLSYDASKINKENT